MCVYARMSMCVFMCVYVCVLCAMMTDCLLCGSSVLMCLWVCVYIVLYMYMCIYMCMCRCVHVCSVWLHVFEAAWMKKGRAEEESQRPAPFAALNPARLRPPLHAAARGGEASTAGVPAAAASRSAAAVS